MARSTRSPLKRPAQSPLPSLRRAASETSELTQMAGTEDDTAAEPPVAIDPVLLALRRPTTTNYSDFWFCPPEKWQAWLREAMAKESQLKKTARNNLNKYSVAGRIMETDEGIVAPNPCYWCSRKNYDMVCMVLNKEDETVCAYCKRHGKGGCEAGKVVTKDTDDSEQRLAMLEGVLAKLQDKVTMLEANYAALDEKVAGYGEWIKTYDEWLNRLRVEANNKARDIYALWKKVWPDSERPEPVIQ